MRRRARTCAPRWAGRRGGDTEPAATNVPRRQAPRGRRGSAAAPAAAAAGSARSRRTPASCSSWSVVPPAIPQPYPVSPLEAVLAEGRSRSRRRAPAAAGRPAGRRPDRPARPPRRALPARAHLDSRPSGISPRGGASRQQALAGGCSTSSWRTSSLEAHPSASIATAAPACGRACPRRAATRPASRAPKTRTFGAAGRRGRPAPGTYVRPGFGSTNTASTRSSPTCS
jgi:hypothetical protein